MDENILTPPKPASFTSISEHSAESSSSKSIHTSGSNSNSRRRTNGRVARIVSHPRELQQRGSSYQYPIFRNVTPTRSLPERPFGETTFFFNPNPSSFICTTQVPCMGQIINGHICFRLIPNIPKLYCPFTFAHAENHHVVLNFQPPSASIPFVLNDTPSIFNGKEIDITEELHNGENYLLVNTSNITFEVLASIEWRNIETPESIVEKIIKNSQPMEIAPNLQFVTDLCPITGRQIKTPGRGAGCAHAQCFDMVAFIQNAQQTGSWNCPICGKPIPLETLRYDPSFLKNCGSLFLNDDDFVNYF